MNTKVLETHLHQKIREWAAKSPDLRKTPGNAGLEKITRREIEAYQTFLLREALEYVYERSSFYRSRFDKAGVSPADFRALPDIARFPFTEPADIAANPYAFACVSQAVIARATTFTSSGTTGPQKRVFFSEGDLERIIDFMAVCISTVTSPGDVVQIMLQSGPVNSQADLLAKGVRKLGGTPVVMGTAPTHEQMDSIKKHHPRVVLGATSRIYRLTKEAEKEHDLSKLGVQVLFATSEYMSSAMRENIKRVWQADVAIHYGLTEMGLAVAVECAQGKFHFNEAGVLLEIIEPQGTADSGWDKKGEMVFTTLNREAMPLIRYRTHDISSLTMPSPCGCGVETLNKFTTVNFRKELVLETVAGDIYPALLDEALHKLPQVVEWRADLAKDNGREGLHLRVEVNDKVDEKEIEAALMRSEATGALFGDDRLGLFKLEILPLGTLVRAGRAKNKIADNR